MFPGAFRGEQICVGVGGVVAVGFCDAATELREFSKQLTRSPALPQAEDTLQPLFGIAI